MKWRPLKRKSRQEGVRKECDKLSPPSQKREIGQAEEHAIKTRTASPLAAVRKQPRANSKALYLVSPPPPGRLWKRAGPPMLIGDLIGDERLSAPVSDSSGCFFAHA
ncbi:hypothetical protein MRB53_036501 [Persea americana]|nr:hypothetical protein MRB53_036693 [Persea americana]KAJ8614186.1 hypothetical protein MRB53_036662 [Persea americana]KAJ8614635.1 hypothetical protein MRB53_036501 [Persea americana]